MRTCLFAVLCLFVLSGAALAADKCGCCKPVCLCKTCECEAVGHVTPKKPDGGLVVDWEKILDKAATRFEKAVELGEAKLEAKAEKLAPMLIIVPFEQGVLLGAVGMVVLWLVVEKWRRNP